ncbi:MAG TPA: cofactor-independent phosphoglycerate mutase [Deltaproteobacteria bacterium]|nr:cofactor-independent phosphoglycerate mutase [Deltaproteobacteria bacterium]
MERVRKVEGRKKYIVLLGDGMGDYPLDELGGKTPLEYSNTPNMDGIASHGKIGLVSTIPPGFPPGSDVANMNLMGYNPVRYHTGRAPLEAASMGVSLAEDDVAFRCNLVYLDKSGDEVFMGDYAAGHITSEEARQIIETLEKELGNSQFHFYPGVSYRHLLVWSGGRDDVDLTPPHDITGEPIKEHLKKLFAIPELKSLFEKAKEILETHPVNEDRKSAGKSPANSIWLWGQGKAPNMPKYQELFGLEGAVISAVDLLKGIGVYAGLKPLNVPGATGYLDTNYKGKVKAAIDAFKSGSDFVYLHVEAPDEASHEGDLEKKIRAIEDFDKKIVGPILDGLNNFEEARVLLATDHFTPISKKTHESSPVPFVICDLPFSGLGSKGICFCERIARSAGLKFDAAHKLIPVFLEK